jgi:hypothetical protein
MIAAAPRAFHWQLPRLPLRNVARGVSLMGMDPTAPHPLASPKAAAVLALLSLSAVGWAIMTLPSPATGLQFLIGLFVAFAGPVGVISLYGQSLLKLSVESVVICVIVIFAFYGISTIGYRTWHFYDEDANFAYIDFPPELTTVIPANTAFIKNSGMTAIQNVEIGLQRMEEPTFLKKFNYPLVYQDGNPVVESKGGKNEPLLLDEGTYFVSIRDIKHTYLEYIIVEKNDDKYTRKLLVWPHVEGDEHADRIDPILRLGYPQSEPATYPPVPPL